MAKQITNRIKEIRRGVLGRDIVPHPQNWRRHSDRQKRALRGVLQEVGIADVLIGYELEDGRIQAIDGHLRSSEFPDQEWDVAILDVTPEEANLLLASIDPLAALAETDTNQLNQLLSDINTHNEDIAELLESLESPEPKELRPIGDAAPPRMAWVLIGIPLVRYGEIEEQVQALGLVDGIFLETALGADAEKD